MTWLFDVEQNEGNGAVGITVRAFDGTSETEPALKEHVSIPAQTSSASITKSNGDLSIGGSFTLARGREQRNWVLSFSGSLIKGKVVNLFNASQSHPLLIAASLD